MPLEEQKLLILFIHSVVSSWNIQILLLTKVAKLTPAINELSVSIYSQLKPCGHRAITKGQRHQHEGRILFTLKKITKLKSKKFFALGILFSCDSTVLNIACCIWLYLMQACVHKVVAKLKEKDLPTEWTFEQDHR